MGVSPLGLHSLSRLMHGAPCLLPEQSSVRPSWQMGWQNHQKPGVWVYILALFLVDYVTSGKPLWASASSSGNIIHQRVVVEIK